MFGRKHHKPKRSFWAYLFFVAIFAGAFLFWIDNSEQDAIEVNNTQTPPSSQSSAPQTPLTSQSPATPLPETFQLTVPFTSQAPTGNWDELHNEACEEASVIMAWAYFEKLTALPPTNVEQEITKLTKWQQDNYGYYLSITTPETARMASEVYGLETEVTDYDEEVIKRALMDNKLVIVPAQGQLLGNPNFRAPGPPYHMLVITGWNQTGFVTNDPGTRNGANYKYSYKVLRDATGNYSHQTKEVSTSKKQIIIVSK